MVQTKSKWCMMHARCMHICMHDAWYMLYYISYMQAMTSHWATHYKRQVTCIPVQCLVRFSVSFLCWSGCTGWGHIKCTLFNLSLACETLLIDKRVYKAIWYCLHGKTSFVYFLWVIEYIPVLLPSPCLQFLPKYLHLFIKTVLLNCS